MPLLTAVDIETRRGFDVLRHADDGRLAVTVSADVDATTTNANIVDCGSDGGAAARDHRAPWGRVVCSRGARKIRRRRSADMAWGAGLALGAHLPGARLRLRLLRLAAGGDVGDPLRSGRRHRRPLADGDQSHDPVAVRLLRAVRHRGEQLDHSRQLLQGSEAARLSVAELRGGRGLLAAAGGAAHLADHHRRPHSADVRDLGPGAVPDPDGGVDRVRSRVRHLPRVATGARAADLARVGGHPVGEIHGSGVARDRVRRGAITSAGGPRRQPIAAPAGLLSLRGRHTARCAPSPALSNGSKPRERHCPTSSSKRSRRSSSVGVSNTDRS